MTRRFLIAAAVLAAGCEQLKAPKRLKDLESRVDELTATVTAMKGSKPGASLPRAEGHKPEDEHAEPHDGSGDGSGSGEPEAAGHGDEHAGSAAPDEHEGHDHATPDKPADEHPAPDKHADKPVADEHAGAGEHAAKPDEHAAKPDEHAAKPDEHDEHAEHAAKPDEHAGSDKPADEAPADAGTEPLSKSERALQDIAKLMASTRKQVVESSEKAHAEKKPADKKAEPADEAKPDKKPDKAAKAEPAKPDKPAKEPAKPDGPLWAYDGKTGPDAWGKLDPAWRACSDGKAQSPIDIAPRSGSASPIVFHYEPTPGTVLDDGHALQVDLGSGSSIEIDDHTYQLVQIQVHRPSEHAIAGEHYPLEVQLVHRDSKNRLAMIAVLYDAGAESRALGALWAKWPRKPGVEDKLRAPLDPSQLLPETRTVYRYTGSLTRPPCTEGVIWNVMRRTMTESKARLDALGQHYKINGRDTQPLNGRKVE